MFIMPKAFPEEFRRDVVAVARKGEAPLTTIAKDFGVSPAALHRWLRKADEEDDPKTRAAKEESAELREAKKRIKLLEQEAEVMAGPSRICRGMSTQNDSSMGLVKP
jgi:transposase